MKPVSSVHRGRVYFYPSVKMKTPEWLENLLEIWAVLAKGFKKHFDTLRFKIRSICALIRVQLRSGVLGWPMSAKIKN